MMRGDSTGGRARLAMMVAGIVIAGCGGPTPDGEPMDSSVSQLDGGADGRVVLPPDGAVVSELCRDCAGCCTSVGVCLRGDAPDACGAGNSVCVACAAGTLCIDGSCQAETACRGCVQGSVCRDGTQPFACGSAGGTCAACAADESCVEGRCVPAASCGGTGWACGASAPCCSGLRCEAGVCAGDAVPTCAALGDACAGLACCGSASCVGGTCRECLSDRSSCTADAQCCGGFCRAGACDVRPDPTTCSRIYDDRCTSVSECCADADSCMYTGGVYRCCLEEGSRCSASGDCCGAMNCIGGTCQQLPYGERCENAEDCLTGHCTEGRCDTEACVPEGTACGFGAGGGRGCCPGYWCYSGRCRVDTLEGRFCVGADQSCTTSSDCCFPAACDGGVCVDDFSCGFGGEGCDEDADCCSESCVGGVCDLLVCGGAGAGCGAGSGECCSGLSCIGGVCGTSAPSCRADGQSCDAATPCCAGLSCDAGRCTTPTPSCRTDHQTCGGALTCCSGLSCSGGTCQAPAPSCSPAGEGCIVRPCCSGTECNASYQCAAPASCGSEGQTCTAGSCCTGLTCDASGRCELPRTCAARGESCASIGCCPGSRCSSASVCEPLPTCAVVGEGCTALPCCSGLSCPATRCEAPPACLAAAQLCGSATEPLGECCADAPFCGAGSVRELNRCRRTCVPPMGSARYASDCCSGEMARSSSGASLGWCR